MIASHPTKENWVWPVKGSLTKLKNAHESEQQAPAATPAKPKERPQYSKP